MSSDAFSGRCDFYYEIRGTVTAIVIQLAFITDYHQIGSDIL